MTTRIVRVLSIAMLITALLTATAFAAPKPLVKRVDVTNNIIDTQIDNAITLADQALNTCMTKINTELVKLDNNVITQEQAQTNIAAIVEAYGSQLDIIAARLITNTDRLAAILADFALKYNIEIINEYVEVQLGNRTYLVDPLRIVGN